MSVVKSFATNIIAAAIIGAVPASASTAQFGYISDVHGVSNGAVLFSTSGSRGTKPACQVESVGNRFALDGSTVAGQAQIAIFLNAFNLHKRIVIVGQGVCTIWPDTETVAYFLMEN